MLLSYKVTIIVVTLVMTLSIFISVEYVLSQLHFYACIL